MTNKPEHINRLSADGAQVNLDALYQIAPSVFPEAADPKTGECAAWWTSMRCANSLAITTLPMRTANSIVSIKEESDIDSLFSVGETSALRGEIKGMDDFELITFLVIRN